jgi:hypothetical protein
MGVLLFSNFPAADSELVDRDGGEAAGAEDEL